MIKDFINSFIALILMFVWFIVFKNSDQPIWLIVLTWVMSLICVFLLFAQAMYKAELEILSDDE